MQTIILTKDLLLSVFIITITSILRITCINSTDDHSMTNSPLKLCKDKFFPKVYCLDDYN